MDQAERTAHGSDDPSTASVSVEQTRAMRAWCEDSFEDMPDDATDAEVVDCVSRCYEGGISQFLNDGGLH